MDIIDNLSHNNHYSAIANMASKADEIFIASPFCFADFTAFLEQIANQGTIHRIVFLTTLKKTELIDKLNSLLSFKAAASRYSISSKIIINNALHGKVYIFKSDGIHINAIITSANITHNGLYSNHEWGCCFDDVDSIAKIEQNILSTVKYELTDDIIGKIQQRIKEEKSNNPTPVPVYYPQINIDDIILAHRFNVSIDPKVRIFIKPIGSNEKKVYNGDYSAESEQYFSRKRPASVRKDDILISYAVGAKKIISAFKVLSDAPIYSGNDEERWPWYVEVENMTPKFGKQWYTKDLYITSIAHKYVETFDLNITNNGGKTLGALQWGADKICLDQNFGTYLLSMILDIEQKL